MNLSLRIALTPDPEQHERLMALQSAFAQVCNELAPLVQQTRVWNRVALHHMAYKGLRERFPALGSQMVCNAIYSVSRASRLIFQTPGSPFHISALAGQPLPLLRFTHTCPVYFDRHTLSIKQGVASMFTLDGRMKFQLALSPQQEQAFHTHRLQEIVLRRTGKQFELAFQLAPPAALEATTASQSLPLPVEEPEEPEEPAPGPQASPLPGGSSLIFPDYLQVEQHA